MISPSRSETDAESLRRGLARGARHASRQHPTPPGKPLCLPSYRNLAEALLETARAMPDQVAFVFLDQAENCTEVSYRELLLAAQGAAANLAENGVRRGD